MPGVAFPPVGPLGLSSPPSPVLCSAKTATLSVSRRFTCRSRPDTLPASVRSWYPPRARGLVEAPRPRQGLWSPGPHSGNVTRRQVALPSSRVTPVKTCPALIHAADDFSSFLRYTLGQFLMQGGWTRCDASG